MEIKILIKEKSFINRFLYKRIPHTFNANNITQKVIDKKRSIKPNDNKGAGDVKGGIINKPNIIIKFIKYIILNIFTFNINHPLYFVIFNQNIIT